MSSIYYYVDDPSGVGIWKRIVGHQRKVEKAWLDFAKHFGGTLYTRTTTQGLEFAGLRFKPPLNARLWTSPDRHGFQWPRQRVRSGGSPLKDFAQLGELKEEWKAKYPPLSLQKADYSEFLAFIGTTPGQCLFTGLGGLFIWDKKVWLEAGAALELKNVTEVKATRFLAAKDLFESKASSKEKKLATEA